MIDGRKLRTFREKRGVTQAQVAKASGISKQAVGQAERTTQVGIDPAERYLNAVLAAADVRAKVRILLDVDVAGPDGDRALVAELREIVA